MGQVFVAEHIRLKRQVAVKVLAHHLTANPQALQRFHREAEIISQLAHPHIVQVLDFDTTENDEPYLVMELLEGESLAEKLQREGSLALPEAVRISSQAASALSAAHRAGIVHRDLKTANIFLINVSDQNSFVKLLDFGISKRTGAAQGLTGEFDVLGTPDYMPPEQAAGKTALVDHRGDQYALAVITYEMLTGQLPFAADNVMEMLRKVITEEPRSVLDLAPHLPSQIDAVLSRALSKTPEQRFANISGFANALAAASGGSSISGLPHAHTMPAPEASGAASSKIRSRVPSESATLASTQPGVVNQSAAPQQVPHSAPAKSADIDPAREVETGLARARDALDSGDPEQASRLVEAAFVIAETTEHSGARKALEKSAELSSRIFRARWGSLDRPLLVRKAPTDSVSPKQAYILSRIDNHTTVEELLDLSPLPRVQTLRLVAKLLDRGLVEIKGR
jgi:serine/threonine-protein kinase